MRRYAILIPVLMLGAIILLAIVPMAIASDMTAKDLVAEAKKEISEVSVAEAKAMLDKGGVSFLDVREPDEFKTGHVLGAVNLPRGLLEFKIDKAVPDKNTKIIVYCKTGGRGALTAYTLGRMGYKNAVNMNGGWDAWKLEGYPSEQD